jgi:acyl-CoA thioesterase-1
MRLALKASCVALILIFFCRPTASLSLPTQGKERIVAMGDSLTAGLGVERGQAYPAVMEKRLRARGYSSEVINAGVSGDTTAGGLRRVNWVLKSRPNLVILELGANDGLRGLDLGETEVNLAKIIERLQKAGARVILAGMRLPTNYGKPYTDEFAAIFPRLAARYHLVLIPFFLEGVAAKAGLNQADGIHPTARGYEIIVDHLLPIIEPLLKKQ